MKIVTINSNAYRRVPEITNDSCAGCAFRAAMQPCKELFGDVAHEDRCDRGWVYVDMTDEALANYVALRLENE